MINLIHLNGGVLVFCCRKKLLKTSHILHYGTSACFLQAPFNLDMGLLLKELNLTPPKIKFKKGGVIGDTV